MKERVTPQWDDPRPNYKWPVAVAQPIAAPTDKVWEIISMPGNLEHCHPYWLQNLPATIRWLPHILYLGPMLRKYLLSVVKGFEWFAIHGESVPRNQFGSHSWFSAI